LNKDKNLNAATYFFIFAKMSTGLKILASPLDWGLGHATRLIPILKTLGEENELIIATNSSTNTLMKAYFPDADFVDIPGYGIRLSNYGNLFSYLGLSYKIWKTQKKEKQWLLNFAKSNSIDLIISDSRFGLNHPEIKSIIISHQLKLYFEGMWFLPGKIPDFVNTLWMDRFDEIWVPDEPGRDLSGSLSISQKNNIRFIGTQSRFQYTLCATESFNQPYILVVLSGPEPQRSKFKNLILYQATKTNHKLIIAEGSGEEKTQTKICANTTIISNPESDLLWWLIKHATLIISRSGYSSLMDYIELKCSRVFLVPTPGQTEQLYLAKRMKEKHICNYALQTDFELNKAIQETLAYKGFDDFFDHKKPEN
jgi:predicted glycosyltransferase